MFTVFFLSFTLFSNEVGVCFKEAPQHSKGLCLEKLDNGTYLNLIPHPDGSDRVFLSTQNGKIWLANVPEVGSSELLGIMESEPFLDISDQVLFDTEFGLMGMAFHSDFANNGRFFLSFNCDKMKHQGCLGRCLCNTDVNCDPSKIGADNGIQPCRYHSVVAEFTVNGTVSKPSKAKRANPLEVRRILTMGLPYSGGHAGQLLFGPEDGYLYMTIGDGAHRDDPYNFAQNKKSLLGKILRIDIDNLPSEKEINKQGLWGNYSIPRDNPYVEDKKLGPEIWALGFKNPWRCSFDSERPSYFLCGDPGQDRYEEVDIVTKGGNYGWRVYEGTLPFHPEESPGGITPPTSINPIFPVMGYAHSEIDEKVGSSSIIGGFFYRSLVDPCMYGRYIYMDLYGEAIWTGNDCLLPSTPFSNLFLTCKDFRKYHFNHIAKLFSSSSLDGATNAVDFTGFMNGGSRFSEITPKWNGMATNSRNIVSQTKRSAGIMGNYKLSQNAVPEEVENFLLHAINMSFFERLNLAWKIVFPSSASRRSSNANIAKQRLKMILFSDRCAVSDEAKQKIVKNVVHALSDFVEIESKDKVQLNVSTDSDLGTIYSVTVPVRRVKAQYQEGDESGTITNIDYKDTGEGSGSVDVKFDFYVPDE